MPDENDNPGVIAPPPLIFGVPLILSLLLNRKAKLPFLPREINRLFGWPLVVGGISLGAWFFLTMKRVDTPVDPRRSVNRIATDGPFGYTRNPAYLAMTMIFAGTASIKNSLPSIILLPFILAVMRRGVIEREERYLEGKFGEEYRRYKATVRRWV
ncbi:MAG: methyltransferase family protein [Rubrobacteraceae bacterium]|jgi:protein-S-isoprenylcysteine O-methyltransferase Ste14|nr:isoprenylcysteine carboxylmethyltransferase family protein [Rubrobacter sp.]